MQQTLVPPSVSDQAKNILRNLAEKRRLTPDNLLREASKPTSPLHSYFCWDDEKAANLYRLDQARAIIASVRIDIQIDEIEVKVPSYVHDVRNIEDQGYVPVNRLADDPEMARQTVLHELRRALSFVERAAGIMHSVGLPSKDVIIALKKLRGAITPLEK